MPPVSRNMLFCELDAYEQQAYDHATSDFVDWYNGLLEDGDEVNPLPKAQTS